MQAIDETIARVENLYRSLTGREPPPGSPGGFPPEKDPVQHVSEQIERLSGALAAQALSGPAPAVFPPLAVWESDTEVRICLELPGVARESVRLAILGGALTVAATPACPEEGFRLRTRERPDGELRRTIALPAGAQDQEVRARMRDGVLEIRIPKRETSSEPRPIPIA